MSHRPLINGTAYEIDKGKPLVGGTVREIDYGKTLVGGTVYEIKLSSPVMVNLIIPSGCNRKVIIDGIEYTTSGTCIALESVIVDIQGVFSMSQYGGGFAADAHVYLNGEEVAISQGANGNPYVTYSLPLGDYPNIVIEYKYVSSAYSCYITEVPDGYALVNITGTGLNNAYKACVLTIDGAEYASATTLVVPIGTVITCAIASMADGEEDGYVKVNGTNVLSVPSGQGTYDYTVTGNVTINMSTVRDADKSRTGYIVITEL